MYVSSSCAMDLGFTNTFFFLFIKYIGVTLVNKIMQVSGFTIPQHSITPSQVYVHHHLSLTPIPFATSPHPLLPVTCIFKKNILQSSELFLQVGIYMNTYTYIHTVCVCPCLMCEV